MIKRIHKYIFYTILTLVYGVFFCVESFYNFEGHSDAQRILHGAIYSNSATGKTSVRTSHVPLNHGPAVRLNKRYHQEDFPPCPFIRVESPVVYEMPRMIGVPSVHRLPSVTITHSQLRGPPFAV